MILKVNIHGSVMGMKCIGQIGKKSLEVKDYQKNSPLKLLMKYTLAKTTVFYGKNHSRHSRRTGHFRKNVTSRVAKTTSLRFKFKPNKKVSVKKVGVICQKHIT